MRAGAASRVTTRRFAGFSPPRSQVYFLDIAGRRAAIGLAFMKAQALLRFQSRSAQYYDASTTRSDAAAGQIYIFYSLYG